MKLKYDIFLLDSALVLDLSQRDSEQTPEFHKYAKFHT